MSTPTPQSERRRRTRVRAEFPLALAVSGAPVEARASDLSELGLACTCRQKLAMRAKVELTLPLPGAPADQPIQGHVLRCTPVDVTGREHQIAIAFTQVPPLCRAAIHAFVQKGRRVR